MQPRVERDDPAVVEAEAEAVGGAGRGDEHVSDPIGRARSLSSVEEAVKLYGEWASTYDDDVFGGLGFTGSARIAELLASVLPDQSRNSAQPDEAKRKPILSRRRDRPEQTRKASHRRMLTAPTDPTAEPRIITRVFGDLCSSFLAARCRSGERSARARYLLGAIGWTHTSLAPELVNTDHSICDSP